MFARRPRITTHLVLLMALSFCLMMANLRLTAIQEWRARLTMMTAPLSYGVSAPSGLIQYLRELFASHLTLQQENAELRSQQFLLKAQLLKFLALQTENQQLRALLDSSPPQGGRMMVAQLIAVAQDPYEQTITVDKGRRYQVTVGQPVLDASGIMGQVIEAGPYSSRVLLLTDPRSAIPVQVARTGERGMAVGDGVPGHLKLLHIPQTSDIINGDVLVTSGLGHRYPAGYPVGTVESVIRKPGEPFSDIRLKPAADVGRSHLVLLFWLDENDQVLPPIQPLLQLLPPLPPAEPKPADVTPPPAEASTPPPAEGTTTPPSEAPAASPHDDVSSIEHIDSNVNNEEEPPPSSGDQDE